MKKWLKFSLIIFIAIYCFTIFVDWFIEHKFDTFINENPDRTYDITYEDFDLHSFFKGITLTDVKIIPLKNREGTVVKGSVEYANLSGFVWRKFLFGKSLDIEELFFIKPIFEVNTISETIIKKSKGHSLQDLFSDILSRIDLNQFQIKGGSITFKEKDSLINGEVYNINIVASDIQTDLVQINQIIPFKLGDLKVKVDSAFYKVNDEATAKLGSINYSISDKSLIIKDLALNYDEDWVSISRKRRVQDDIISFKLDELSISGMDLSSNFWTDLDIKAQKMQIDGLVLTMNRNKNLKRPPDIEKPLFKGLVDKIPYNIDLDSINISNTDFLYGELSINKHTTGVIELNKLNGSITKFTTFPESKRKFGAFEADLKASINNAAELTINLKAPYDKDGFSIRTSIGRMDMTTLSPSLVPLIGLEINKGELKHLEYHMDTNYYLSRNRLVMDYDNLHLTIYNEEGNGSQQKKGILSSIANLAVRHHNLPEDHGYLTATYTTPRNIYRSPFQHIVNGLLDGAKHIIPRKSIQFLINHKK